MPLIGATIMTLCVWFCVAPCAGEAQNGPLVTFFGITGLSDTVKPAVGGIVQLPSGIGFHIVVEGRPGASGSAVATHTFGNASDPSGAPDLQIFLSRPIGPGSVQVCDEPPLGAGGVPAGDFLNPETLNDLGCHFQDSNGQPVGRGAGDACVFNPIGGEFHFVSASSTIQFCSVPITSLLAFAGGDTTISVRLRDTNGNVGPVAQLTVHVQLSESPTPTPTGSVTPTGLASPSAVPTATSTSTVASPTTTATTTDATITPTSPATPTSTPGISPACDVSNDGSIARDDLDALTAALYVDPASARADVNGDGAVSAADIVAFGTHCPENHVSVADQLAAIGVGRRLGISPTSMRVKGDWEEYLYAPAQEQAICLRGAQYQVNLRRGASNNVLLYLEGGGACWNYDTCWVTQLAKLTANSAQGVGVLDASNADNPFRDWNIVYAPYCDGSVFGGDNIPTYNGHRTFHHGLQNLSAAVTLLRREFPDPTRIVVSGSSAGGFGTYSGYGVTRVAFPNTDILVFDDSGPGIQNPADTAAAADRLANWHYAELVPTTCTDCATQLTYLTGWALERDPTLRVAYFDYLQDGVLRFFLSLDADAFQSLLLSVTDAVHARHPTRFKRFFPAGESHTVLELPIFYTEAINDLTVRDWTVGFLNNDPAWQDLVVR